MLIWLAEYLIKYSANFYIFFNLIFRSINSLFTALFISLWIGPGIIKYLQKISFSQVIRINGPKSHLKKNGTPTMGGIIILISITISILIWTYLSNPYIWCILLVLISYGMIGFIDDYRKIIKKNSKGISVFWKYFWQSTIALITSIIMYIIGKETEATKLVIPFFKDIMPSLGIFYILLTYLVIVSTSNAVNITDGLDGLVIMPIVFISAGFSLIAWEVSNIDFSNYLHVPYFYYASELIIVCTSIIGAGLGFLWFNTYPAQIFMGDVGSLSLGGILGTIAVLLRQELLLIIMGGIFVLEALSVIFQVSFFKLRGQRIFRMAPIHHHYELKNWPEPRIVVRFWIISLIFVLIGLIIFKA